MRILKFLSSEDRVRKIVLLIQQCHKPFKIERQLNNSITVNWPIDSREKKRQILLASLLSDNEFWQTYGLI